MKLVVGAAFVLLSQLAAASPDSGMDTVSLSNDVEAWVYNTGDTGIRLTGEPARILFAKLKTQQNYDSKKFKLTQGNVSCRGTEADAVCFVR